MGNTSERLLTQCLGQLPSGMGQGDIAVREPCWELHPSPQWARSKCGPACPICWHQCHVLGSLPRARQPPQHGTACTGTRPGSQCCPRPALQVCPQRCPWGSATSTCSCWVKQSQRLGKQGRKTHPSLTCLALLYSTPFFLVHAPCHRAASCKGSRKSNQSLEEHHHLLLLTEEHTDPPGS